MFSGGSVNVFVDRADFKGSAEAHAGDLGHQLDRVVEVHSFQDHDAAELLLGFGEGAVGDGDLAAVLETKRGGGAMVLERLAVNIMTVPAKFILVGEVFGEEGLERGFAQGGEGVLVVESEAEVFHKVFRSVMAQTSVGE